MNKPVQVKFAEKVLVIPTVCEVNHLDFIDGLVKEYPFLKDVPCTWSSANEVEFDFSPTPEVFNMVVDEESQTCVAELIIGVNEGTRRIVVPHEYNGMPVVSLSSTLEGLAEERFYKKESIEFIYVPSSIQRIESRAFSNLKEIEALYLSEGLESIGILCFTETDLSKVNLKLPSTLKEVEIAAFNNCKLTGEIELPVNLTELGVDVFSHNEIEKISIAGDVGIIPDNFITNNQLKNVVIPDSVYYIGRSAFAYNPIERITLNEGLECIGEEAFAKLSSENPDVKIHLHIPKTVKEILSYSFYESGIHSLTFHRDSVLNYVGEFAFTLNSIKELILPQGLTSIGREAFTANNIYGELIIPDNLEVVEYGVFSNNEIESVVLGKNTKRVETNAFAFNELKRVEVSSESNFHFSEKAFAQNEQFSSYELTPNS